MTTRHSGWLALALLLLGLLTVAAGAALDYATFRLRLYGRSTFDMRPVLWGLVGSGLLLAALFLATAWLAMRPTRPWRLAGVGLFVAALPVALYPALIFARPLRGWLPVPVWLGRSEHLHMAGAFVALLGLYVIIRRGEK